MGPPMPRTWHGPPVILLIGRTGSGKSSFVQSLTTHTVKISGEKPCTTECETYSVNATINGQLKSFIIIDTPGFGDMEAENLDVLEMIAKALRELQRGGRVVSGAIYFHNILDGRLTGNARFALEVFKSICGRRFYPRVAFMTTSWDALRPQHLPRYKKINHELESKHMNLMRGESPRIFKRLKDDMGSSLPVLEYLSTLVESAGGQAPPLLLAEECQKVTRAVRETMAGRTILKGSRTGGYCTIL